MLSSVTRNGFALAKRARPYPREASRGAPSRSPVLAQGFSRAAPLRSPVLDQGLAVLLPRGRPYWTRV
jgi:hypothetical protein